MSAPTDTADFPLERLLVAGSVMLGCAALAYAVVIAMSGTASVWDAVSRLGGPAIALGLLVCGLTFLVRFLRWQLILSLLGHHLATGYSLRVYLAGMAMSSTPGKLGETMRSALLMTRGVPVRHSLGGFVADRLSDVIAVALIGAAAAALGGHRLPVLEAIAAAAIVGAAMAAALLRRGAAQSSPAAAAVGLPGRARRWAAMAITVARPWAALWTGWRPAAFAGLAVLAYGVQSLVFAAYVARVAPQVSATDCVMIFSSATLIGAASLVPGGLGAMDSALVWQLQSRGVAMPEALAAALATRVSTLWLAWLVGFGALLSFVGQRPSPLSKPAQGHPLR